MSQSVIRNWHLRIGSLTQWLVEVEMDFTLSEELQMIRDMARDFVTNELLPIEREVLVRDGQPGAARFAPIPREKFSRLKKLAVEQGLWAMTAPEALGGGGLNTLGACLVAEELGKTFVDFDFGDIPPILFEANAEQGARFLQPAITGEIQVALALREPGTDEIQTRATRAGDAWLLNGVKLAGEAEVHLVFARAEEGVTCFIVERLVTQDEKLQLKDVGVSGSNVLGRIGGAFALGKKSQAARTCRAAARTVGVAVRLLEISSQYARDWKAWGQPLAVRPGVQHDLADMAIEIDAARWLVYHAACAIDAGKDARDVATRAHLFATEMIQRTIDRTRTIYGGPAHMPDLPIPHIYLTADAWGRKILAQERFQVANSLVRQ